jgi:hypothetical protein
MQVNAGYMYPLCFLMDGVCRTAAVFHQPFDGCPFRLSNNINCVNGDADGDGDGEETHSLLDAKVNAYQYMYVKESHRRGQ